MDHQTAAQMLGNYGEFVGAIAVVATLLYLARQIKQANLEAITATTQAVLDSDLFVQSQLIEYAETWNKVVSDEPLAEGEEAMRGLLLFNLLMGLNENRFRQIKSGHFVHNLASIERLVHRAIYPEWRASGAAKARSPEFLELVDERRQNREADRQ